MKKVSTNTALLQPTGALKTTQGEHCKNEANAKQSQSTQLTSNKGMQQSFVVDPSLFLLLAASATLCCSTVAQLTTAGVPDKQKVSSRNSVSGTAEKYLFSFLFGFLVPLCLIGTGICI